MHTESIKIGDLVTVNHGPGFQVFWRAFPGGYKVADEYETFCSVPLQPGIVHESPAWGTLPNYALFVDEPVLVLNKVSVDTSDLDWMPDWPTKIVEFVICLFPDSSRYYLPLSNVTRYFTSCSENKNV